MLNIPDPHAADNDFTKVYVQLRPDSAGISHLMQLQQSLALQSSGRMMPEAELHMTVIHFGQIDKVFKSLCAYQPIDRSSYDVALHDYVHSCENLNTNEIYTVAPIGVAKYGARGGTLVVEYRPQPELIQLHAAAYGLLLQFFAATGLRDSARFITQDPNFKHAATLRPHITLYKGYEGELPLFDLEPINLSMMPVRYDA